MNGSRRRVLGALLAGGASSRFGSPKWRARLGGETLGGRGVHALASALDAVVVLSSDPDARELGRELWPDLEPGQGPLGGVRTALRGAARLGLDAALVLACDLPLAGPRLLAAIVARWRGEEATVPLGPGGPEPLCALYSLGALPAIETFLEEGGRSARGALERLDPVWLPLEEAILATGLDEPFLNVNTADDLLRAEERLRTARCL